MTSSSLKALKRNLGWNYASGLVSMLSVLALLPWSIAVAGPTEYGTWLLFFSAVQLLALADFGLGTGLIRAVGALRKRSADKEEHNRLASIGVALFVVIATVLTLVSLAISPVLLRGLPSSVRYSPTTSCLLIIALTALLATIVGRAAVSLLAAENRPDLERKAVSAFIVVRILALLIAGYFPNPVVVVAVGEAISIAGPGLLCFLALRRYYSLSPRLLRNSLQYAGSLTRTSLVLFVGAFAALATSQLPIYATASTLGLVATTAFAAVMRVHQSTRMLLSWTVNPFIAEVVRARPGSIDVSSIFNKCFNLSIALGLVVSAPLVLLSDEIVDLWLGQAYAFAAPGLVIVGLGVPLLAVVLAANLFINFMGRPWHAAILHSAWLVTAAILFLVPSFRSNFALAVAAVVIPLVFIAPGFLSLAVNSAQPSSETKRQVAARSLLRACALYVVALIAHWVAMLLGPTVGLGLYGATLLLACGVLYLRHAPRVKVNRAA